MNFNTIIVDDDSVLIILMKKIIERLNFPSPPSTFESGDIALDFLRDNYNTKEVFCILLDINMPFMNGWEFLDELKKFALPQNTFVFAIRVCKMTSRTSKIDQGKVEFVSILVYAGTPPDDLLELSHRANRPVEHNQAASLRIDAG